MIAYRYMIFKDFLSYYSILSTVIPESVILPGQITKANCNCVYISDLLCSRNHYTLDSESVM